MGAGDRLRLDAMDREALASVAAGAVLVLPIAATEQHGPALPLGTDTALVDAAAGAALAVMMTPQPVVLAPTVPYGNSVHHLFAGAGSLTSTTLLLVLADLIDSMAASGFRRVFVLNGHGGNDECVRLAVKDAVNRHPILAGAASYWTLAAGGALPAGDVPGHAGAFEASLLMAARPDLLAPESAPPGRPGPAAVHTRDLGPGVTVVRAGDWPASGGFTDPPGAASVEAGRDYLARIGQRLAGALDRFADLPLTLDPEEAR